MVPHNKKVLFVVFSSAVLFKFLEELRSRLLAVAQLAQEFHGCTNWTLNSPQKIEYFYVCYMEAVVTNYCKAMLSA
jgi:hypothetical protein